MTRYIIAATLILGTVVGAFPAYAGVSKDNFNLVAKAETKKVEPVATASSDMNDLIYLKARIKELERENAELKKNVKQNLEFGRVYVLDGRLRCKDYSGGKDWEWINDTWERDGEKIAQPLIQIFPKSNCPNGQCPLK